jgi:hypothetical protein
MLLDSHFTGVSSSPDVREFVKALVQAQATYRPIAKSEEYKVHEDKSYWYSTWKDIVDAIYPSLLANGIVFLPRMTKTAEGWLMVGTLIHGESGEWMTSTCPIRDVVNGHGVRTDPQSFEIGCTYAKKVLLKTLAGGWEVGDETSEHDAAQVTEEVVEMDAETEALNAKYEQVEAALRMVANDEVKLRKYRMKIIGLVTKGELRESDAEVLAEKYPLPEETKEVMEEANAL